MSTKVQDIPQAAADVVSSYRQAVSRTNALEGASAGDKRKHVEKLTAAAVEKLSALQSDFDSAVRASAPKVAAKPVGGATEQLLDETKKGNAWAKLQKAIDLNLKNANRSDTPDVFHVITDAIDKAVATKDVATLSVMRDELPDYLNQNNLDMYAGVLPRLLRPADSIVPPAGGVGLAAASSGDVRFKRVEQALAAAHTGVTKNDPTLALYGHTPITAGLTFAGYEPGSIIEVAAVPEKWVEPVSKKRAALDANGKLVVTAPVERVVDYPELT